LPVANAQLRSLAVEVQIEFGDLCDCVWKFNGQIEEIRKTELSKLDAYFPDDPHRKARRWLEEGYKVNFFFPLALNYSFVVLVFIELENKADAAMRSSSRVTAIALQCERSRWGRY
jgi:hypothetical protein